MARPSSWLRAAFLVCACTVRVAGTELPTPPVTAAEAAWNPLLSTALDRHTGVYDPVRDRMIVFGGDSPSGLSNRVLAVSLAGAPAWSTLGVSGAAPLPRRGASAVYDPVRDRMLVFGGSDGTQPLNDVWALSLTGTPAWSLVANGGARLPAREHAVLAYDAARDRLVIFGGLGEAQRALADCWALTLGASPAWSALGSTGPQPAARHSACGMADALRDRLVVFGGADSAGTLYGDTWTLPLAGGDWAPLPLASGEPQPRMRACSGYDASRDQMIVYGGRAANGLQETVLALSFAGTASWTTLAPSTARPAAREWAAMVVDPVRDRLVVHGGAAPGLSADVFTFALGGAHPWATVTPSLPPRPFRAPSLIRDPLRNRLLLFGGMDAAVVPNNSVWSLDLSGPPVWTLLGTLGTPPDARGFHSAIYDPVRDRMLVYGGVNFSIGRVFGDVWELQLAGTPTWQLVTPAGVPPSARYLHSAIYDPVRDRMVVYGGTNGATFDDELWTLDLSGTPTWNYRFLTDHMQPGSRGDHSAVYDPVRDRMIIGFGFANTGLYPDLWGLSLANPMQWQRVSGEGAAPTPRFGQGLAFDGVRDRLLLFGGSDLAGLRNNEVWALEFAAVNQWRRISTAGPSPIARSDFGMVLDVPRDRLLITGGRLQGGALANDLVALEWAATLGVDEPPVSGLEPLLPPFPNPARGGVTLRYRIDQPGTMVIALFDVGGRRVRSFRVAASHAGTGTLAWDGRDEHGARVGPGVYLAHMTVAGRTYRQRIVRLE